MATPMSAISQQDVANLQRQIRSASLYNRQLASICQVNGLKSTGVKAELQSRILNLIQETANSNDVSRFYQVRQSIYNAMAQRSPAKGAAARSTAMPAAPVTTVHNPSTNGMSSYATTFAFDPLGATNLHRPHTMNSLPLTFRQSPFYSVISPLGGVKICEVMTQHRNTIHMPFNLSDYPAALKCIDDSSYKIFLFCASDVSGAQDVTFPHQSELRVNGGDFKANLRGLKNKPGSTRPVDVTSALRMRQGYMNNIDFTYALTKQKFYLVLNLCKISTVDELSATISARRRIPKDSVIAEINKKAQDPDVVATSQVLSLKCPLTYMRLNVPCRGMSCTHIQCFDTTSYLQLQEQGPQWLCPICNKSAKFEQLAIDEYVRDILENTPKSLEAVTIETDGQWTIKAEPDESPIPRPPGAVGELYGDDDDDDDDIEISEISFIPGRSFDSPRRPTSMSGTPTSSVSRANGVNGNNKRPAPVIDLTLSSDDEDEPVRPAKRQNSATNGFTGSAGFSFPHVAPSSGYPGA